MTALEATSSGGRTVAEIDVDNLIETLMNKLVALDGITVEGEMNLQKRMQVYYGTCNYSIIILSHIVEVSVLLIKFLPMSFLKEKRVQKYIETLDMLKLQNSTANSNGGKISLQRQENSIGKMPIPIQNQPVQPKQMNVTVQMPMQQPPLQHSESVVVTTKWETFD